MNNTSLYSKNRYNHATTSIKSKTSGNARSTKIGQIDKTMKIKMNKNIIKQRKMKLSDFTLKDVDLENLISKDQIKIDIDDDDITVILKTIQRDINFFRDNGLMDYSLLLGIEKIDKTTQNDASFVYNDDD